jgi:hypothetical protein
LAENEGHGGTHSKSKAATFGAIQVVGFERVLNIDGDAGLSVFSFTNYQAMALQAAVLWSD